jgi:hypothetical protein
MTIKFHSNYMKQCFKCQEFKPLGEFYRHPRMSDGHLNKCKLCAMKDVSENYHKRKDQYAAYERDREERPDRKASKIRYQRERRRRHPNKYRARNAVSNAIRDGRILRQACEVCGTTEGVEAHHVDYDRPLDVRWLCFADHRAEHGQETLQAQAIPF